jgi:predicted RNase H-like nuclease
LTTQWQSLRPLHWCWAANKKTPEGEAERLSLLGRFCDDPAGTLAEARSRHPRSRVADDDILDAMVLAVAARAALEAGVPTPPASPERDSAGLRMEIVSPVPVKRALARLS